MQVERRVWVLLCIAPLAAIAADAPAPSVAPRPAISAADTELLEFLGEFDDAKGEFVDPFVIDAVSTMVDDADRAAKRAAQRNTHTDQPAVASPATSASDANPPEKTP